MSSNILLQRGCCQFMELLEKSCFLQCLHLQPFTNNVVKVRELCFHTAVQPVITQEETGLAAQCEHMQERRPYWRSRATPLEPLRQVEPTMLRLSADDCVC